MPLDAREPSLGRRALAAMIAMHCALLAGCATSMPDEQIEAERVKTVCVREVQVGTLMPQLRCRTVEQIERERAEAHRSMNFTRQGVPDSGPQ